MRRSTMALATTLSAKTWLAAADDLEDPVRRGLVEGQIAELVNGEHGGTGGGAQLVESGSLQVRGLEALDHVAGGGEEGPDAGLGGGDSESDAEMCLTHSGWPEQDDVAALVDPAQGRELTDQLAVEG